jgi:hypothetical protein
MFPSADGHAGLAWKHLGHIHRTEFTLTVFTFASNKPDASERGLAVFVWSFRVIAFLVIRPVADPGR